MFSKSIKNEKGQGLVEYAIILALVAVVVIAVMSIFGEKICTTMESVSNSLPGEGNSVSVCGKVADAPSGPQDFGSTQWKNGFDTATPINNFCASEGSGTGYNFYSIDAGTYSYYIASGQPWTGSGATFMNTGTCP